jgi:hypothetical protein
MPIECRWRMATGNLGVASAEVQASIKRRPFGSGMRSPNSLAVSIHSPMASFTAARALCWVDPCAMQPGSSGTSARYVSSSLLQYRMISYLVVSTGGAILHNNRLYLTDLVRFCVTSVSLKIDPFLHARLSEQMMAAVHPERKSKAFEQPHKSSKRMLASALPLNSRLRVLSVLKALL